MRPAVLMLVGLIAAASLASGGRCAVVPTAGWPAALAPALPDPVPIRRLHVTPQQLAEIRKASDPGPLVRLAREEFERRVRLAAVAQRDRGQAVQLVEAHYSATLGESDLVGKATWVLENPNPQAAAFNAEPLRLAITAARWADDSPAVLGLLGPGFPTGPALWVPPGRQVLSLEWSAMGTDEPGERRFELSMPAARSASVDLDLPADRIAITTGADVLLSSLRPAKAPGRKTWQFRFGPSTRFEFAVRPEANPRAPQDPVRASLVARHLLDLTQIQCSFEYDLVPVRGSTTEWLFDVDPEVRILDAVATDRAGWQMEPASAPGGSKGLRVKLRQPSAGGKVLITALAPPASALPTQVLPMIRPRNGRIGDESLVVRLDPQLKPAGWTSGDYRLLGANPEADRSLTFSFTGSLRPAGSNRPFRQPPGIGAIAAAAEYETRESLEWRLDSGRAMLDATVRVRVRRGSLFSLPLQVSPGYTQVRAASSPEDALAFVGPAGGTPPVVQVEFQKPIAEGQEVELRLELRGPVIPAGTSPESPVKLPLPRVTPLGAVERVGSFRVMPRPGWQVQLQLVGVDALARSDSVEFRGRDLEGTLYLSPWTPDWNATSRTVLTKTEGRLTAETRMVVRIPTGSVTSMTLLVPEADGSERTWRLESTDNSLASVTAVPLGEFPAWLPLFVPLSGGWSRLAIATLPDGPRTAWRLTFARPVRTEIRLVSSAPVPEGNSEVHVPLLTLVDCNTQTGTMFFEEAMARDFAADPVREAVAVRDTRLPGRVTLPRAAASTTARGWRYESLSQTTEVQGTSSLSVVFRGRVAHADGTALKVTLPAGAIAESAKVGQHWLSPEAASLRDGIIELPMPVSGGESFEIRYRLPSHATLGVAGVSSPRPGLPDEAPGCEQTWQFSPEFVSIELPAILREGDSRLIAPASVLHAAQFLVTAAILALGWWFASRRTRPSGRTLCAGVLAFALALTADLATAGSYLRMPTLAAGLALAMLIIARGCRRQTIPTESSGSTQLAVMIGALLLILSPALQGQPVEPVDVYLLADGDVLVPQTLLDRLEVLSRPVLPGAVITEANYDGRTEEGSAIVAARFTVHNLSEGPASLTFPLADVRLEEMRINDAPAFPTAPKPDQYAVTIPGKGRHTVTARFAVPVKMSGADREVRFGIPEVPHSEVAWVGTTESRQLTVLGLRGQQALDTTEDGPRLSLDLGSSRSVHLRWREGPGFAATAAVSVRQVGVWSVREAEAELIAAYLFTVSQGSSNGFRFELPAEIDLTRVAVRSPDPGASVVLRDWTLGPERGGVRPVRVQFQSPVEGRVLVILECVPRQPLTVQPTLKFPKLLGNVAVEYALFGFRTERTAADALAHPGLEPATESLTRDFPGVSDLQFPAGTAPRVFRALSGSTPEFRPSLRPSASPATVVQEASWGITPTRRAEGVGTIRWVAKDAPLSAVEFDMPAVVRLLELRGPALLGWSVNAAGRVQAWFKTPQAEPSLEWAGTVILGTAAKGQDPVTFEPPFAKLVPAGACTTTVRVQAPDGWGVKVDRDRGWSAQPTPGRALGYLAEGLQGPPQWTFYPPRANTPSATGFGTIEVTAKEAAWRVVRMLPTSRNRPAHLFLRLGELPSTAVVETVFPAGVRASPASSTQPQREWNLDVPGSGSESVRVEVLIRLPLPAEELELPDVTLEVGGGAPLPASAVPWLGLITPGNAAWRLRGAVPTPHRKDAVRAEWPAEMDRLIERGGTLWAPRGPRAAVRLERIPIEATATAPPKPEATIPHPVGQPIPTLNEPLAIPYQVTPLLIRAAAIGACLMLLTLLALRFPRSTWPEQLALLVAVGLVSGGASPLLAIPLLVVLRLGRLFRTRRSSLHPTV